MSRLPGSESGACLVGPHSPWSLPFAPPTPWRIAPLCSSASQLLWQSLTSRDRASPATAPRLPDADRRRLPNGRSRDLPVPAQGASAHARFFDHAGPLGPCDGASETCCLPHSKQRRHPGIGFRGSAARSFRADVRRFSYLEPISKSFEEHNEAGKLDKAEEIVGVVLPTNEDPALPLKPGEEALDEPASHVAA